MPRRMPRMNATQALWAVITVSTFLRLVWAASVGADTNEAYYYMYWNHPSWGYFDHPPMVGLVTGLGMMLTGGASLLLGVRIGFILLFAGSTWLMARLTSRYFGETAGVLAAFTLNATAYFGLIVGTASTTDGPLLFFWLLTLDRLAAALDAPERIEAWMLVGLAWGCTLLSKYHGVLLPAGFVLYLLVWPPARRCLRTPGPYLAVVVGLALFAPVIGWNAAHDWASFRFQGWRAAVGSNGFKPLRLAEAIGEQALYLLPWIWIPLVVILFRLVRRGPRRWSEAEAFLACQSVPALGLFMGVATFRHIMPHWPLIAYVALMPILGKMWAERLAESPKTQWRWLVATAVVPIFLAGLVVAQARFALLLDGRGRLLGLLAPQSDPTIELISWDPIARELDRRNLLDRPNTFLFTEDWRDSAQLGFATRLRSPVACYTRDARSFAYWSRPEDWVGRDGIFVTQNDDRHGAEVLANFFDRVDPLGDFSVVRCGVPIRTVHLFQCVHQTSAFPFGYTAEELPGSTPPTRNGEEMRTARSEKNPAIEKGSSSK